MSLRLSSTPRGARLARLPAAEQLHAWGLPLDPARQIVAELAANAATHGRVPGRDFGLTLYVVGDTLRIEVTDTRGDVVPHAELPVPETESGRGLVLVEALADKWGVAPRPAATQDGVGRDRRVTVARKRGRRWRGTSPPKERRGERTPTKPHPSRPSRSVTPASEYAQLGWL